MRDILKLTLCTLFMMMHGNYMMATRTAPTPSANTTATKQTLQNAAGTGQYYCTFVNAAQVPITLSFGNNTKIQISAKGSFPVDVTNFVGGYSVIASDQTGKNQPSQEVTVGNYGYNTKAVVKIEKITKTEKCLPSTNQMHQSCKTLYSKTTVPTLSIVFDELPKGSHKPTGSKVANFQKPTIS